MVTVAECRKRQRKWDLRFLDKASFISKWSKDPSTKCGSVVVKGINDSIKDGYNGYPPGVDDDHTLHVREEKYPRVLHAEVNAILRSREDLTGCTLYVVPLPPCARCAGVIIQSGIKRVVSVKPSDPERAQRWETENQVAMDMFSKAGVDVEFYEENLIPRYTDMMHDNYDPSLEAQPFVAGIPKIDGTFLIWYKQPAKEGEEYMDIFTKSGEEYTFVVQTEYCENTIQIDQIKGYIGPIKMPYAPR